MNFETIKTYILTILVLISLLLTFALWNYQPNYEPLNNNTYVNEVDIGGKEESKRSLIEPNSIIFHNDEHYSGFTDPFHRQKLYQKMQDWVLSDYQASAADGRPTDTYQIELAFSSPLPAEFIRTIFSINEEDSLPNMSFQHMFILFNQENSTLEIIFLSTDGQQQIKYVVNNSNLYTSLWSYFEKDQGLSEYIPLGSTESPIFIPKNEIELKSRSFSVKSIDASLLIDALFWNPSLVSTNIGEAYFTDGQRGMNVLQDERRMEFINPIHSNDKHTDLIELIDQSVTNINEHKGWTNNFKLVNINSVESQLLYRMHHDGYPIYNHSDLSIIEQQWLNQELRLYRRPLFSMDNLLGGNDVKLPSGERIVTYLTNHESYEISNIKDVQVAYKLTYFDGASYSLTLDPAWYMEYNGNWTEIKIDENDLYNKGGG